MSEAADNEDRTEQPSEKRLRQARESGDVPRSRELANVAVLGCATIALKATAGHIGGASRDWMQGALRFDRSLLDAPERLPDHAAHLLFGLVPPMLPLVGAALIACVVGPMVMGGLRFASKSLQPDFSRLNPAAGLKRMYGKDSLAELVRAVLRVLLIGGVGAWVVHGAFGTLVGMADAPIEVAVSEGVDLVLHALLAMVGALGVLALVDVPWQHIRHRAKLKMTRQELRDEAKESEGNPEMKARVRHVAREMSRRRMMDAVPTADVVLMNPTHYAVALKYNAGSMRAPTVVAKGVDETALAIRALADKHRVAIVEAPPLARALYRQARLDQEVPVKLYAAVAQVLSYVYQLKAWVPGRGPMPALPAIDVGADGAPDDDAKGSTP